MSILLGAIVSILVQALKKWAGTREYYTLLVVIVLSLAGAFFYQWLIFIGYWEAFLSVLTTAGAIYTFIIRRFEK